MKVNVIDLFAGPGGLGEGFFSYRNGEEFPFKGICSVEMEEHACNTLTLRAFYRKVIQNNKNIPSEYYLYQQDLSDVPCNLNTIQEWEEAQQETFHLELGKNADEDLNTFSELVNKYTETLNDNPTILIGGPPCQAYSLVGRARNKGKKDYIAEEDHRHFLYQEYLKIMTLFSPEIFIMENVKGMLSSKINGGAVFQKIVKDLQDCGDGYQLYSLKTGEVYQDDSTSPRDFILESENYGIPQARHRVIIVGIKKSFLKPEGIPKLMASTKVTVNDAIGSLPKLRSQFSNRSQFYRDNTVSNWQENLNTNISSLIKEKDTLPKSVIKELSKNLKSIKNSKLRVSCDKNDVYLYKRFSTKYSDFVFDSIDKQVMSHEPRPHMDSDLVRYFFCSTFKKITNTNSTSKNFPDSLAPAHKNWKSGKFVDRFKVQGSKDQSSTITSHISKDGHYFIHPDPLQCRSLTVREAARLQSFPDSYLFMGKRTNQYQQVGNAVPPLLANQIAEIVYKILSV